MNLEIANNLVKAAEGDDEIYKDAIFCLSSAKNFKEHQNTSPEFTHCLAQFKSPYQASKKNVRTD